METNQQPGSSYHRFYELLDKLSTAVSVHDPQGRILYSNQAATVLLGMSREQMQNKLFRELSFQFFKEDGTVLPRENDPCFSVIQRGKEIQDQVIGIGTSFEDRLTWVNCNAYPEFDQQGQLSHVIVNWTNITRERKLVDLNVIFEAALDQSPAGIAIVEAPSGKLIYLNQAGFLMRGGGKPGQSVKDFDINTLDSFWHLYSLDGTLLQFEDVPLMRAIHYGEETSAEFILRRSDQADRIMWTNVAPIFRRDKTIMAGIAVFLETTTLHVLEDQLKVAQMKSRFLDVAAHELRTPVTAFSLLLQFAQRQLAKGHAVDSSILDRLRSQVDRISHLVVDLLDVTRLQHGAVKLKLESKDLVTLISECLNDYRLRAPERNFIWQVPTEPVPVKIDSVRVYQVLSNLLDNALKYTEAKSPVAIRLELDAGRVRVSVQDYGSGIPKEQQGALFLPFSRGSGGYAEKSGGLGLGLFICREIIELHGGKIDVLSEVGVGSTFYFEIPLEIPLV